MDAKKVRKIIEDMDTDELYRLASEIDSQDGRFMIGDAGSPPMPYDEMVDLIENCGTSASDIINMTIYGNVCGGDDWLGLDGYGNFQSYNNSEARDRFLDEIDELVEGVMDGYGEIDYDEDEDEEADE